MAIPKTVFTYFTVFRAVSAPKTTKLPDLSGRQIRQLLWKRYRVLIEKRLGGCVQAQYPLNNHFHSHRTSTAPALQLLRFVVEALKNAALFRSGYNCKIDKWTLALEAGGFARYVCLLKTACTQRTVYS